MEDGGGAAAPFVAKTYSMVNDPATEGIITWGRENNSFVVINPYAFSRSLLPMHFKHSNFSSFVRQLNTYGFRKVDPDRWEFAHASFLRGQMHLLSRIVRRNSGGTKGKSTAAAAAEDEEEGRVVMEVVRLKREQRATEEEVQRMWRRVRDAERRPKQMLAFLVRLLGDPELLRGLMGRACADAGREKRARLRLEGHGGSSEPAAAVDMVEHLGLGTDSPLSIEEYEGFVGDDEVGPFFGVDGADAFMPAVDPAGFCGGRPAPSYAYDHCGGEMDGGGVGVYPFGYE